MYIYVYLHRTQALGGDGQRAREATSRPATASMPQVRRQRGGQSLQQQLLLAVLLVPLWTTVRPGAAQGSPGLREKFLGAYMNDLVLT